MRDWSSSSMPMLLPSAGGHWPLVSRMADATFAQQHRGRCAKVAPARLTPALGSWALRLATTGLTRPLLARPLGHDSDMAMTGHSIGLLGPCTLPVSTPPALSRLWLLASLRRSRRYASATPRAVGLGVTGRWHSSARVLSSPTFCQDQAWLHTGWLPPQPSHRPPWAPPWLVLSEAVGVPFFWPRTSRTRTFAADKSDLLQNSLGIFDHDRQ